MQIEGEEEIEIEFEAKLFDMKKKSIDFPEDRVGSWDSTQKKCDGDRALRMRGKAEECKSMLKSPATMPERRGMDDKEEIFV